MQDSPAGLGAFSAQVHHISSSSGVNFASPNRFPRIIAGDYLEGGLTSGTRNRISNRIADAYGDLAGGVRISDQEG